MLKHVIKYCLYSECEEETCVLLDSQYLSLDDYDCIGFDLDHTLCRYNVGPMIRSVRPLSRPSVSALQCQYFQAGV